ncbi:MAG: SDR family NAD(P)-dependent oxidoreductase [Planctomycetes bacterium]|nr:SDR family NAD(P)-dependent oxidoreductase [Planctomycetota bacterium]
MASFQRAFLTGASSGLGAELARQLARRGTEVVVTARRRARLDALVAEITAAGGRARAETLDVRDADAVRALVARLDVELGGFDLVVANAGVGLATRAAELTWEQVDETFAVNLRGAAATLLAGRDAMLPRGRGTLCAITSLAATRGMPTSGAYCASKAGLATFVETLEIELRATGLRFVDVQPGFVVSEMTDKNTGHMPLLMQTAPAVARIVRGLERGDSVVAFPRRMAWPLRTLGKLMPRALWRFLSRRAAGS